MNKETKYLGSLRNVKIHPIKRSIEDLATVGLRLDSKHIEKLYAMLGNAIEQHATTLVVTGHRRDSHVTLLFD